MPRPVAALRVSETPAVRNFGTACRAAGPAIGAGRTPSFPLGRTVHSSPPRRAGPSGWGRPVTRLGRLAAAGGQGLRVDQ